MGCHFLGSPSGHIRLNWVIINWWHVIQWVNYGWILLRNLNSTEQKNKMDLLNNWLLKCEVTKVPCCRIGRYRHTFWVGNKFAWRSVIGIILCIRLLGMAILNRLTTYVLQNKRIYCVVLFCLVFWAFRLSRDFRTPVEYHIIFATFIILDHLDPW